MQKEIFNRFSIFSQILKHDPMKNQHIKNGLILILCFGIMLSCNTYKSESSEEKDKQVVTQLDPSSFKKAIESKSVQLVDVRTPEEFEEGHISNADNVDYLGDAFEKGIQKFDKSEPIYVYCRSGNRSGKAIKIMVELGFDKIYELDGGFLAWE